MTTGSTKVVDCDGDVSGSAQEPFEPVARAFAENVSMRGDSDAACAVYYRGELVVDLWSGQHRPSRRSCVFSVSKAVTTVCVLMAAERGQLRLDAPVADYWPEFAAAGKGAITLRQVLAHRAGLAWPDQDLTLADVAAWDPVVQALAAQAPAWEPDTAFAYHALTVGWVAGEVLRRATALRPRDWLRQHIARPLGLDMDFGAVSGDPSFLAQGEPLPVTDLDAAQNLQALLANDQVVRALSLGAAIDPADLFGSFNRPEVLSAELPAGNLVTDARSLARLFAATVHPIDGVQLLDASTVSDACTPLSYGTPFVGLDEGHVWGTGFMLASRRRGMAGPGSFGHDGAGGQLAFAHPQHHLGFGYVTTRPGGLPDDRAEALCAALRDSLDQMSEG